MQRRQRHEAQAVARVVRVGIARVIEIGNAFCRDKRLNRRARHIEQRPPMFAARKGAPRRHRRQTVQPAATQRLQYKRLRLIVAVVCGEQHTARGQKRRQRLVTQRPRPRFGIAAAVRPVQFDDFTWHAARRRFALAKHAPICARCRPAVIDVTGEQRRCQPRALQGERLQQRHAVAPAAQGEEKGGGAVFFLPAPERGGVGEEHWQSVNSAGMGGRLYGSRGAMYL